MLDDLYLTAGGATAAATAVAGVFWKYEDVASAEMKSAVVGWLKYRGPNAPNLGWTDHLVIAFNKIFGERHLTLKCFRRSCLASLIAVCLMFVVWRVLRPQEFALYFEVHNENSAGLISFFLVILAFFVNCLPDYVSYMKTRSILRVMSGSQDFLRLCAFALLDTMLTIVIFAGGIAFASITLAALFESHWTWTEVWNDLYEYSIGPKALVSTVTLRAPGEGALTFGVFFYAALFVAAWSWLYGITALVTRFALRVFPKLMTRTVWFFDVEGHPLRSLGCIAGGIVFVGMFLLKEVARA
jgi:hypothetical protein